MAEGAVSAVVWFTLAQNQQAATCMTARIREPDVLVVEYLKMFADPEPGNWLQFGQLIVRKLLLQQQPRVTSFGTQPAAHRQSLADPPGRQNWGRAEGGGRVRLVHVYGVQGISPWGGTQ